MRAASYFVEIMGDIQTHLGNQMWEEPVKGIDAG